MAKKKKLTARVRAAVKAAKGKVRLKDYTGEALKYVKQYKQLAKARKAKADSQFKVGKVTIDKNTELYKVVAEAAAAKGITVKHFVAAYFDEIELLLKNGNVPIVLESDRLIDYINDLPEGRKTFVAGVRYNRATTAFIVKQLKFSAVNYTDAFLVLIESYMTFEGDLHIDIPTPDKYERILRSVDDHDINEREGADEFYEFIDDNYPDVQLIRSPER